METISIEKLKNFDKEEINKLICASRQSGFYYISDYNINLSKIKKLAQEAFDIPLNIKESIHISKSLHFRGWSKLNEEVTKNIPDYKESYDFGIDKDQITHNNDDYHIMIGKNQYPPIDDIETCIQDYITSMKEIGMILIKSYDIGLNLNLSDNFTDSHSLLRFLKYPASKTNQGIGEHTDYGGLTIIYQNAPGLQIKDINNNWVDVLPHENKLVVNIGDVLENWSSGLLKATPHRVINNYSSERLSIPFFFEPNIDTSLPYEITRLNKSVKIYGEHLHRSYKNSYPRGT